MLSSLILVHLLSLPAARGDEDVAALVREQVSRERLLETVRELVKIGPRMGGTESGTQAAQYLEKRFRDIGLEVQTITDPEIATYEPLEWEVSARQGEEKVVLESAWPYLGSPPLDLEETELVAAGAPDAEGVAGRVVLTKGHVARGYPRWATSGARLILTAYPDDPEANPTWAPVYRLRSRGEDAGVAVFGISHQDAERLRSLLEAGPVQVSTSLKARIGKGHPRTIVAEIPGRDESRALLFCAHGDSDGGGPGADDNASGEAVVLEIATVWKKLLDEEKLERPPVTVRFAIWGAEIHSTRHFLTTELGDPKGLVAVINYDQAGTGAERDAIYVEPDDVEANREIVKAFHRVLKRHHRREGFWKEYASNKSLGGTDSYVFQNEHATGGRIVPAVTLFSSAWGRPTRVPPTPGIEQPGWEGDPGEIVVDYSRVYHASGDTPENTTEKEPANLERCTLAGLLGALEVLSDLASDR